MASTPDADPISTLGDKASAYLDVAHRVAVKQFGQNTVDDIPLLVVQTAQMMVALKQQTASQQETM